MTPTPHKGRLPQDVAAGISLAASRHEAGLMGRLAPQNPRSALVIRPGRFHVRSLRNRPALHGRIFHHR